jgi:cytoskeletal protein RodZ
MAKSLTLVLYVWVIPLFPMSSIGERLREERLRKGLDLEDVAERTKINANFLLAIEAGDFEKLPGSFFARSFVRQYARTLGLDASEFEPELQQAAGAETSFAAQQEPPRRPADYSFTADTVGSRSGGIQSLSSVVAFVLIIAALAGTYALWQGSREAARPEQAPAASTPVEQPPPPAAPVIPKPEPAAAPAVPLRVEVRATAPSWIRVDVDDKIAFEGTLQPEDARTFEATSSVRLRTGNAGALQVNWNGKLVEEIGPAGQIRTVWFDPNEYRIVAPAPPEP